LPLLLVERNGLVLETAPGLIFEYGDNLLIADTPAGLRELAGTFATELFQREGPGRFVVQDNGEDDQGIVELVVGPKSPQKGRSLRETRFAEHFGVVVIALHRTDEDLLRVSGHIGDIQLAPGDLLLAQGPLAKLEALRGQWDLMMLDSRVTMPRTPKAPLAMGIMAGVIALAAFKVLPIHIAALLGVALLLWRGGLLFEHVGRALSLEVVLLVVASLALGQCLVGSGAADWLASGAVSGVRHLTPALQVASVMALAAVLTNFVSNSAAAAIGTPIAVTMARQLGITPEPFVLAILFGANLSYATPMAYQTNMLIMTAAKYRFGDFVRVGLPLLLMMLAALSFLLVRHYGL
jgi:di/tricarboxylate transporter